MCDAVYPRVCTLKTEKSKEKLKQRFININNKG